MDKNCKSPAGRNGSGISDDYYASVFIEPTVGIMNSYGLVKGKILPLFIACFLSFAAVIVVTGSVSQAIMRFKRKEKNEHE